MPWHFCIFVIHFWNCSSISGVSRGRFGSCKGDSGGPLMIFDPSEKRWFQVGMVHGSVEECGHKDYPGIYVRLEAEDIMSFIRSNAGMYVCIRQLHLLIPWENYYLKEKKQIILFIFSVVSPSGAKPGKSFIFFSSCWPMKDHKERSNRNSNPVMTFSAGGAKVFLFRPQVLCTPNLYCPIANPASTQSQQPV